ncbi:MAG: PEP-CTERM sorting domain-containing protein [Planctomycetes bacterium]|nr:PEP-CTERM sorting domain-containing protein [Planctomycetota bacterium]
MKALGFAGLLCLIVAPTVSGGVIAPIINEWVANHTGTDTNEYVEILGDPNTDYSAWTILEIEGDSSAPGTIDDYAGISGAVGTTDANGIFVTAFSTNGLENGSMTLLLVKDFAPINPFGTGDDIDTDDDGVIDTTFWSLMSDSVGVNDGGAGDFTYGEVELVAFFDGLSFSPGGASRIPNGTDTDSVSDWRRNAFNGEGIAGLPGGALDPVEALNTPGLPNVPEPATLSLLALGGLAILRRRR